MFAPIPTQNLSLKLLNTLDTMTRALQLLTKNLLSLILLFCLAHQAHSSKKHPKTHTSFSFKNKKIIRGITLVGLTVVAGGAIYWFKNKPQHHDETQEELTQSEKNTKNPLIEVVDEIIELINLEKIILDIKNNSNISSETFKDPLSKALNNKKAQLSIVLVGSKIKPLPLSQENINELYDHLLKKPDLPSYLGSIFKAFITLKKDLLTYLNKQYTASKDTPLHFLINTLCAKGAKEPLEEDPLIVCIQALLDAGADPNIKNKANQSGITLAATSEFKTDKDIPYKLKISNDENTNEGESKWKFKYKIKPEEL